MRTNDADGTAEPSAILNTLRARASYPLRPETPFDPSLSKAIDHLEVSDAVKAGLHMLNDDLPKAHELAQAHEGDKTHDYWHAIVHRREGDFDNAKYWLGQVRRHPVMTRVHDGGPAAALGFIEKCRDATDGDRAKLESIQRRELLGLLEYALGA